jgi:hypothetical protein
MFQKQITWDQLNCGWRHPSDSQKLPNWFPKARITTLNMIFTQPSHLQCCNYCHIPSDFSSNFESSMTIFHHKLLLTREGRDSTNGWIQPSSMTVFLHIFIRGVIRKVVIVTLNTMFSVASHGEAPSDIIKLHEWFIFHTSRGPHISRDILGFNSIQTVQETFHQCSAYVNQANHIKVSHQNNPSQTSLDSILHTTYYPSAL